MDEKELKTSGKQRFFIILIAILMLGSAIASSAAFIVSGGKTNDTTSKEPQVDEAKIAEYEKAYNAAQAEFSKATKDDYGKFIAFRSNIKAYNEAAANSGGIQTNDLTTGTGRKLKENDTDYLAYYVGWCANEKIFDSSFDNNDNPSEFISVLEPSDGLIEGWKIGVSDMKLGGIREITIPSELAYKDGGEEVCGANKPLKFIVMAVEKDSNLLQLSNKAQEANMRLQYAYYGIDYDSIPAE